MPNIHVLDESTINQIAAGEVVERPSAIVKELIENAMDAGATAITAEIKEGGLSFIRITDNGSGIAKEDIPLAFLRHATSKIRTAEDLLSVTSLGFRGEALSSIAAVGQVELITKTPTALNGYRYLIEGGEEKSMEEIGCPGGTTIIVRNIFFNTPARRKFLKSAMTETGYISDLMERLIVSHPDVAFKFITNNQVKLQSSGNNNSKDILYHIYGRDISKELLSIEHDTEGIKVSGYIGKPIITRGNRNFENYFINGRYIKSNVITKAIEEAYKPFLMQHKYPFTSIYFEIDPSVIDVNVHPQKMEIRLKNSEEIYQLTYQLIRNTLAGKEMIPRVQLTEHQETKSEEIRMPEPFEQNRRKQFEGTRTNNPSGNYNNSSEKLGSVSSNTSRYPSQQTGTNPSTDKKFTLYEQGKNSGHIIPKVAERTSDYIEATKPLIHSTSPIAETIAGIKNTKIEKSESFGVDPEAILHTSPSLELVSQKDKDLTAFNKQENTTNSQELDNQILSVQTLGAEDITQNGLSSVINTSAMSTQEISTHDTNIQANNAQNDNNQINITITSAEQMTLFKETTIDDSHFLSKKALEEHRIIGQIFATYWLVEFKKELYIIDQHAAHEKVLYEKIMTAAKSKTFVSQQLLPPIVLTLSLREQEILHKQEEVLISLGYEFEHFGGNEYSVRAVPADVYSISEKELLLDFLDSLSDDVPGSAVSSNSILERAASLSCKAAVKANHALSYEEASALIKELLTLENPYHCPHGRPVIISMSQYEIERKFKRIV